MEKNSPENEERRENLPLKEEIQVQDNLDHDNAQREEQDHPNGEQKHAERKNEAWEWTKAIAIAFVLAFLIRTFLFAPTIVDGRSMLPTLSDHEWLIVNKIVYRISEPDHGEIIVFHAPVQKNFIKRVIGVGGDVVEMRNDILYINGEAVDEGSIQELKDSKPDSEPLTYDFGPFTVPDGHLFVLGDNRRHSKDSRSPEVGMVPLDKVVGRADVSFWPLNKIRLLNSK